MLSETVRFTLVEIAIAIAAIILLLVAGMLVALRRRGADEPPPELSDPYESLYSETWRGRVLRREGRSAPSRESAGELREDR